MSRLSRFLRSALCQFRGHQLGTTVTNTFGGHSRIASQCARCRRVLVSYSQNPDPWWLPWMEAFGRPAIERSEGLRPVWAPASARPTSPSQKAPDTESASAPSGAGR